MVTIILSSLFVGVATKLAPFIAGGGVPEVKLAFWGKLEYSPLRIAVMKFLASAVGIGGGQSLGRAGPAVQIGGNLALSLAELLGVSKQNRRAATAAGAAAGLAADFNTPLAALAFVFEGISGRLNKPSLGPVLLASVTGAFVVHAFGTPQPAFLFPRISEPTWRAYSLIPLSSALAALIGGFFQRGTLALRDKARDFSAVPSWVHPVVVAIITWGIGATVFVWGGGLGVFSLGYDDISDLLAHGIIWKIAVALLVGKFIATLVAYGLGGCGGIFSPTLFFGAMSGAVVAALGRHFMGLTNADTVLVIASGMSACFATVAQAPVTAILIIFEMTHQFALVPGLVLAGLVGHPIARALNRMNFYDAILQQGEDNIEHLALQDNLRS